MITCMDVIVCKTELDEGVCARCVSSVGGRKRGC